MDYDKPNSKFLAKDFDTFKHKMIATISERVLGWMAPTSEADLDLALIELASAIADELSDYQDRVVNELYLSTARKQLFLISIFGKRCSQGYDQDHH